MARHDDDETEIFPGARALKETPAALCVRLASGREHWVPKSQIHDDSEVFEDGHVGKLIVKQWFAEKEGMR